MKRNWVHAHPDVAFDKKIEEPIAIDCEPLQLKAHDEQMIRTGCERRSLEQGDERQGGKARSIGCGDLPSPSRQFARASKLFYPDRGRDIGHIALESGIWDIIAPVIATLFPPPSVATDSVEPPGSGVPRQPINVRHPHAPLARGDRLRSVK